jgi:hypothetical protein
MGIDQLVGDERALPERRVSESVLASIIEAASRGVGWSVGREIGGPGYRAAKSPFGPERRLPFR